MNIENIVSFLSEKYNFDKTDAINELNKKFNKRIKKNRNPKDILINIINKETKNEEKNKIWTTSEFSNLPKLQSNNVGKVGEKFCSVMCKICNIKSNIDGTKTKKIGGGNGDGIINNSTIEIKTAHYGISKTFQHELGEKPWNTQYIAFLDIHPTNAYLIIFKNFTENVYKNGEKCEPFFPTKKITWRKNIGAFKFDTSIKLNEFAIKNNFGIKIDNNTTFQDINLFINKCIT